MQKAWSANQTLLSIGTDTKCNGGAVLETVAVESLSCKASGLAFFVSPELLKRGFWLGQMVTEYL